MNNLGNIFVETSSNLQKTELYWCLDVTWIRWDGERWVVHFLACLFFVYFKDSGDWILKGETKSG